MRSAFIIIALTLLLTGFALQQQTFTRIVINRTPDSRSALEINADPSMSDWAMEIRDDNKLPRRQFNAAGAMYSNSWDVLSGVACKEMLMGKPCTPENWRPVPATRDAHMRSDWGDTPDVDVSRAANVDPLDAYLWRGISWKGEWRDGWYEGHETFAVRSDGTLFWGRKIGRKSHDTSLTSPAAGVLVTPGRLQAQTLALSDAVTFTQGEGRPSGKCTGGLYYQTGEGGNLFVCRGGKYLRAMLR